MDDINHKCSRCHSKKPREMFLNATGRQLKTCSRCLIDLKNRKNKERTNEYAREYRKRHPGLDKRNRSEYMRAYNEKVRQVKALQQVD